MKQQMAVLFGVLGIAVFCTAFTTIDSANVGGSITFGADVATFPPPTPTAGLVAVSYSGGTMALVSPNGRAFIGPWAGGASAATAMTLCPSCVPAVGNFGIMQDNSADTWINASSTITQQINNNSYTVWTAGDYSASSAGFATLGGSNPWGATRIGAGNSGYTGFTAIGGTHNSQDNIVQNNVWDAQISTYSAKAFQTYTLPAHRGIFFHCTAVARVVTAGSGGVCSFWATGVHGSPDSTYSCTIENTGWQTTAGTFASFNNPDYTRCDCSGGLCTPGSSPTNPLLTYSGTTASSTITVNWTVYNDSCTIPPVLDVTSTCNIVDN